MKYCDQPDFEVEDNIRVNISLSPNDVRRLRYWARLHGKTHTAYAAQVIATRIEENFEALEKQLAELAKRKGISVEQLKDEWDNDFAED
ncbi:MAG: hypothetical protein F6K36_29590 [Symploca sp. SIO3C6]|uniref:CopG family transcriptional regulator n=1 Tax=Symploca sp. SIO1C4 TaxID=2607765 RepID=A0A6B3NRK8_9CYAN|nr:hypothetical protein [Symploca sp. SIO3C6]NER31828.1 hypothetical protein [Symploca sp. SIO1C4]